MWKKLRQSQELVGKLTVKPLEHLRKLADEIGTSIDVHTTNPPSSIKEILDLLKAGDVFCHVFQGKGTTIIGPDGIVLPEVYEAQKRGVFALAMGG